MFPRLHAFESEIPAVVYFLDIQLFIFFLFPMFGHRIIMHSCCIIKDGVLAQFKAKI